MKNEKIKSYKGQRRKKKVYTFEYKRLGKKKKRDGELETFLRWVVKMKIFFMSLRRLLCFQEIHKANEKGTEFRWLMH